MNQSVWNQLESFIEQNLKAIAALLAALVLALVIVGLLRGMAERKEQEAADLLFQAHGKAEALAKTDSAAAAAAYEPLLEKYSGTRAAFDASLQMGDVWMTKGDFAQAEKAYSFAVDKAQDNFSKVLALYNRGAAYESAGNFQSAVSDYAEAEKNKTAEFLRPELLMAEARCYEGLKNVAKASELYKTVTEKYAAKNSFYSGAAAVFLSQLSAQH